MVKPPTLSTIHPFPARMAPELARLSIARAPAGSRVIDPMCGSGTVLRAAVEAGLQCVGFDIDPLSALISKVWTSRVDAFGIEAKAIKTVEDAKSLSVNEVSLPDDKDTAAFVAYWFAPAQIDALGRLAAVIRREDTPENDLLAVAFSRIIISKEMMASLARDTSHSRPHRVASHNDFDAYAGFLRSARYVAKRLLPDKIDGSADVRLGDARRLDGVENSSFDLAITSPPYLNAIDYMRGHRLTLVWLGYKLDSLRKIKSENVGIEKALPVSQASLDVTPFVKKKKDSRIEARHIGWILRYATDMKAVLIQLKRIVKPDGEAVLILGNSFLRGAFIDNAGITETLAISVGFRLMDRTSRNIPARRRYLPPPRNDAQSALDFRMRTETVLTFRNALD